MRRPAAGLLALCLGALALPSAHALQVLHPPAIEGIYSHFQVESSSTKGFESCGNVPEPTREGVRYTKLPRESAAIRADLYIPARVMRPDGQPGSDPPFGGGIMLLTKEQYGHDPGEAWLQYIEANCTKGIVLVEDRGLSLYRRWDPYTSMPVPVLQVTAETGDILYDALINGTTGRTDDRYVTVKLFGNKIVEREKELLKQVYNDYAIKGDGRTTFFATGWFQLEASIENTDPSIYRNADPCLDLFTGVDCNEFGQVTHLHLRAVTGKSMGVPELFGDFTNLTSLYLYDSEFSSLSQQSIPGNLGDLAHLQLLRIEEASMHGSIPNSLSFLTQLKELLLARNRLSGTLPMEILNEATSLRDLDLSNNQLQGTIPSPYYRSPVVRTLRLNGNSLNGGLLRLSEMKALELLTARENSLSGALPLGPFPRTLRELDLGMNSFSEFAGGQQKNAWSDLVSLETLVLDNNNLTWASFPQGFKTLPNVRTLDLRNNRIRTTFPMLYKWLGAAVKTLSVLALGGNEIYGDIAQSSKLLLPEFTGLATLDLSRNLLGYNYSQACAEKNWQTAVRCADENNELNKLQTCSNSRSPKSNDCVYHNSLPLLLPPQIRYADFSGNHFGDGLPRLYGDYEQLEMLDLRGNQVEALDAEFRMFQWRNTPRALPPWATTSPTRIKYEDAGGSYHCPLLALFGAPTRSLWVDPIYYEWSFCECEYGFYVDAENTAQAPHCTPFPTFVPVTGLTGNFTDGTMGGRVRTGMDTKWHISTGASTRVLAVQMEITDINLNNDSTLFIYAGDSRLDKRVARLSGETAETALNITVLHNEALLWFESPDDVGPHWNVQYKSFLDPECPPETHMTDKDAVRDPDTGAFLNLCWPRCERGFYAQVTTVDYIRYDCLQCPLDYYQDTAGFQKTCKQCPLGSTTDKEVGSIELTDCQCRAGQAGNFEYTPGVTSCTACDPSPERGFECPGGSKVFPLAGYYKAANSYNEYLCLYEGSCLPASLDEEGCARAAWSPRQGGQNCCGETQPAVARREGDELCFFVIS